jgi:hypothetical protein
MRAIATLFLAPLPFLSGPAPVPASNDPVEITEWKVP